MINKLNKVLLIWSIVLLSAFYNQLFIRSIDINKTLINLQYYSFIYFQSKIIKCIKKYFQSIYILASVLFVLYREALVV